MGCFMSFQEISDMDHSKDLAKWPHLVSRTMTVVSTVTDPMIYLFFNDTFRKIITNLRNCNCQQSTEQQTVIDSSNQQVSLRLCCVCWSCDKRRVAPNDLRQSTRTWEIPESLLSLQSCSAREALGNSIKLSSNNSRSSHIKSQKNNTRTDFCGANLSILSRNPITDHLHFINYFQNCIEMTTVKLV